MRVEKGAPVLCPLCDGDKVNRKYVIDNWTYFKCNNCKVVYLSQWQNPRLTDLYNKKYFDLRLGGLDTTDNRIRNYYRTIGQLKYFLLHDENKLINYAEIGPGDGSLAMAAQHAGWKVKCFDVSGAVVERLSKKGLDVVLYKHVLPMEKNKYDLVVMSHVIEHLTKPMDVIKRIHQGLHRGGLLYISTPNVSSMDRFFHGPNWTGWDPPYHIVLFSENTLKKIVQPFGFETIHTDHTFFNPLRHLSSGIKAKNLRADIRNFENQSNPGRRNDIKTKSASAREKNQILIIHPPQTIKVKVKKIFSERNVFFIFKKKY